MANGAFTPPQYSSGPAMVSITVLSSSNAATLNTLSNSGNTDANGTPLYTATSAPAQVSTTATMYVFQAVLSVDHEQRLEKTHHPVQTSADVSSHAYLMPARCVLDIGMSDAMAAYTSASTTAFTGSSSSTSVNAYQTMLSLQASRSLLTVTTRLRTYTNMVVDSVSPREDHRTITSLRMRVEFGQILMASANTVAVVSARPDSTTSTGLGTVNPSSVSATTQQQYQVPAPSLPKSNVPSSFTQTPSPSFPATPSNLSDPGLFDLTAPINTPGAGGYSSIPGQNVGSVS